MAFLFDVDGTLTPPMGKMSKEFKDFFMEWMQGKEVYLVTGSDKDKTIKQVGKPLWTAVSGVWQVCGNEFWQGGGLLRSNEWDPPRPVRGLCDEIVGDSKYPHRFGNHVEFRTGMINLSTVGRKASKKQRAAYAEWDEVHKEREHYCKIIKRIHRWTLDATVGGQISIDIYPIGCDKSQVLNYLYDEVHFFGDKCKKGGNDYSLAEKMRSSIQHKVHQVRGPEHTMKLLKKF